MQKSIIKKLINEQNKDSVDSSTPTPGPTKAKLNIFDFNEITLEDKSLTSLNQEFNEYKSINIECDIDIY